MRALSVLFLLITASLMQKAEADDSIYQSLVEIQKMGTFSSVTLGDKSPYQMDFGDRFASGHSERRTGQFGWGNTQNTAITSTETTVKIQESEETPRLTGKQPPLIVARYTGDELGTDELPYVDAAGNADKNYSIFLTSEKCIWCHKMYKDVIAKLRGEGYKIYVVDVDEFKDIKDRIDSLDPTAEKIGAGTPYFVVREGGKTKNIFHGYTSAARIRPHLKKLEDNTYDIR